MSNQNTLLEILRFRDTGEQTLGKLSVFVGGSLKFECVCLEPSWILNMPFISCIPCDTYPAKKHDSPRFGVCVLIENVPGRSNILVHKLNFFNETEGCVGVGTRFAYINSDLLFDLKDSDVAFKKLMAVLPDRFQVVVRQAPAFQMAYVQREVQF